MNDKEKVLTHLNTYGSITPYEAIERYHMTRLSARIWELRNKDGLNIPDETVYARKSDGTPTHYKRYFKPIESGASNG